MKILVLNYSFDASTKQITFTDYNPIVIERVLLITNITDNIIIYNFADPTKGGTSATNVLTLTYDTGTMSDTDKLQIFYDDAATTQPVSGTVTANLSATDNTVLDNIDSKTPALGQALAAASVPVVLTAAQVSTLTPPAQGLTDTQLRATAVPVSVATIPSHAVTNAGTFAVQSTNQANSGVDIGDVTINNATGASAVNIQDGGNAITVDNGGTFATQATLAAETTKVIGTVNIAAAQTIGITANSSVNTAQINGVTVLMGAGNTGTGSQRVTIASDQAAVASKAAINTYVDGSIVTIGAKADAKSTATDTTAVTMMQVMKQISASVQLPPGGNIAHDAADSGNPIKVGGRASTTPITAVAANDRVDAFFDVQGRQVVVSKALTGTASNVAASATSATVLAANTARLGATIWNDSTAILYLKLGATASTTSCTVKMIADAYYEVPFGYYGIIDGIWASATGAARVTELT